MCIRRSIVRTGPGLFSTVTPTLEIRWVALPPFSLRIFETEPVFDRIAAIEKIHAQRLAEFREHSSVAEVRMLGTIAAIELRANDPGYLSDIRTQLYPYFLEQGVLLRPLGNVIYTVPPYVTSEDDMHYIYDVIEKALR